MLHYNISEMTFIKNNAIYTYKNRTQSFRMWLDLSIVKNGREKSKGLLHELGSLEYDGWELSTYQNVVFMLHGG